MSLRMRQLALLVVPVARMVPWAPGAAAALLSLLACVPAIAGAPAPASQVFALRITAFLLGTAAGFALIEPMTPVPSTPTPHWLRQWLRTLVALIPAVLVWLALFSLTGHSLPAPGLPFADLAAEASVCGLTGVAGAAVAARRRYSLTAALAGPAAQGGLVAATLFVPGRYSPWILPSVAPAAVHIWWTAAVSLPVLVLVIAGREPVLRLPVLRLPVLRLPGRR